MRRIYKISLIFILFFLVATSATAQYVPVPVKLSTSYSPQDLATNQPFTIYVTVTANQQVYNAKCKVNPSSDFTIYKTENYFGIISLGQSRTCSFSAKAPSYKTSGNLKIDVIYTTSLGTQTSSVVSSYLYIPVGAKSTNRVTFQLTSGGTVSIGTVMVSDLSGNVVGQGTARSQCSTCAPTIQMDLPTGSYDVKANGQIGNRNAIAVPRRIYIDHAQTVILFLVAM